MVMAAIFERLHSPKKSFPEVNGRGFPSPRKCEISNYTAV